MDDDFLNEFDEICGIILGIKYLFNIFLYFHILDLNPLFF